MPYLRRSEEIVVADADPAMQEEIKQGKRETTQDPMPSFQALKRDLLKQARSGERRMSRFSGHADRETFSAASNVFMLFSLLFRYPTPEVRRELEIQMPFLEEVFRACGAGLPQLPPQTDLEAEHVALFVNNNGFVPAVPYASFYLDAEGQLLGPSTRRLRSMMSALGLALSDETFELVDHVYVLLELCAELCGRLAHIKNQDAWLQWLGFLFVLSFDYLRPLPEKLSEGITRYASFDLYPATVRSLSHFVSELDGVYASALGLAQESPAQTDCVLESYRKRNIQG